jgi:hypothetical protein
MTLDAPARRGLIFLVVGVFLLVNVGHFHIVSPGDERYEYQRVAVTAADDDTRFTVDGEWANRPESIAGIGCDGLTDTSSTRLCVLETWLLNGSGQPRTLTIDRPEVWTTGQAYTVHGGQFYERTRTTHRISETVPEGQVRVTLTPRSPMEVLNAIAVPIERAPPELRRVIRRDSLTTDHYVEGAEVDTELPPVPANEYDDGGLVVETQDGFVVVTTSYHTGKPALRFVAGALQWLLGLGLVVSGGHRYLTHL